MKRTLKGKLEVICGSMFSGKTEELIRRLRRAQIAGLHVQAFKHNLDNRITKQQLYSHNGSILEAFAIDTESKLQTLVHPEADVIGIDEIQFFPVEIVSSIQLLIAQGKQVLVAGLDMDFRGLPFGCMPTLLALADTVCKLKAVCLICGDDAHFTQRIINNQPAKYDDSLILIGAQENYQARCRGCYQIDRKTFTANMM